MLLPSCPKAARHPSIYLCTLQCLIMAPSKAVFGLPDRCKCFCVRGIWGNACKHLSLLRLFSNLTTSSVRTPSAGMPPAHYKQHAACKFTQVGRRDYQVQLGSLHHEVARRDLCPARQTRDWGRLLCPAHVCIQSQHTLEYVHS